ncbi:hypothetical protein [Paraglaciecola sp.]|uniref:hypothetical protein n=1 Tax=Paraglaciecola sp. TaxID=1920173 RepID=UPI003EF4623D
MKKIIILGMHRSGTSALARLLEMNKISMGPLQDKNNESKLYAFDMVYYLNFLGGVWDSPWSITRENNQDYINGKDIFLKQLKRRFKLHRLLSTNKVIGFKHPIASLLVPELSELDNVVLVRMKRDTNEIINSLSKRSVPKQRSWLPGQIPNSQHRQNLQYLEKLVHHYEFELDRNQNLIDVTINYNDLVNGLELKKFEKISNLIGKEISVPSDYFKARN